MSETHSTSTAPSRRGVLAGGALAPAGVLAGTAAQAVEEASDHAEAVRRHRITGVKHEDVYHGLVNSGIYASVKERGEVKGIYCGHDHINTYTGDYYGVELGYAPGTGFDPYGLNDGTWDQHTLCGARVFELDERNASVYAGATRIVWARDLGIDMNPEGQPLATPVPFPPSDPATPAMRLTRPAPSLR
ncbi:hypothetical protein [Micrococcus porci]|uniref:hypothetical protein n=1 Tax=Micrococcus porci TaxID=2856555 RepID=UPI003CFB11EC